MFERLQSVSVTYLLSHVDRWYPESLGRYWLARYNSFRVIPTIFSILVPIFVTPTAMPVDISILLVIGTNCGPEFEFASGVS